MEVIIDDKEIVDILLDMGVELGVDRETVRYRYDGDDGTATAVPLTSWLLPQFNSLLQV